MGLKDMIIEEDFVDAADIFDDAIPAQCYSTKDYSKFKPMVGNRDVSPKHVRNIIESMKRNNLIKFQTVTVNENFEIVDGQHRFEACKVLGIHVHYKIKEGANYQTAGILNQATEEWKFLNYLENFAKNEHVDYIKLEKFQEKHNVSLKRFRYLISDEQRKIFDENFKTGEFKLIDDLDDISKKIDKINEIIKYLDDILIIDAKKFLYTDNFWRALYVLLLEKDVEIDRFKEKISTKYQSIRQMSGYKDYVRLFTDIYNWKAKKRIK
jgi:hypothetical protein